MHTLYQRELYALDQLIAMGIQSNLLTRRLMLLDDLIEEYPKGYRASDRGVEIWKEYMLSNLTIFSDKTRYRWNWYEDMKAQNQAQSDYVAQEFMGAE